LSDNARGSADLVVTPPQPRSETAALVPQRWDAVPRDGSGERRRDHCRGTADRNETLRPGPGTDGAAAEAIIWWDSARYRGSYRAEPDCIAKLSRTHQPPPRQRRQPISPPAGPAVQALFSQYSRSPSRWYGDGKVNASINSRFASHQLRNRKPV